MGLFSKGWRVRHALPEDGTYEFLGFIQPSVDSAAVSLPLPKSEKHSGSSCPADGKISGEHVFKSFTPPRCTAAMAWLICVPTALQSRSIQLVFSNTAMQASNPPVSNVAIFRNRRNAQPIKNPPRQLPLMPAKAGIGERSATHEARPPTVAIPAAMTNYESQGASARRATQMPCDDDSCGCS